MMLRLNIITLCLGIFLIIHGVESQNSWKSTINRNIDIVKKKLDVLENEVKGAIRKLQERITTLISTAVENVDKMVSLTEDELLSYSEPCRKQAEDKLSNVKDSFIMDLINCKRNQLMITDIEKVVYSGKNLMDSFVTSAETLIKGFESCISFNPFEIGFCVTKQLIHTGVLIAEESVLTVEFTVNVAEDTENLAATAVWCIRNANNNVNNDVQEILKNAKTCHKV